MRAEARLVRPHCPRVIVAGGARAPGPAILGGLLASGATALISVGVCGGLDPSLPVGAVIVPEAVIWNGAFFRSDGPLSARLGRRGGVMLSCGTPIASRAAKSRAFGQGAAAVDLETGALAAAAAGAGLPWAALRVVCDPAWRDLPGAAAAALDEWGRIRPWAVLRAMSVMDIPALIAVGLDAAKARRALRAALRRADWTGG